MKFSLAVIMTSLVGFGHAAGAPEPRRLDCVPPDEEPEPEPEQRTIVRTSGRVRGGSLRNLVSTFRVGRLTGLRFRCALTR